MLAPTNGARWVQTDLRDRKDQQVSPEQKEKRALPEMMVLPEHKEFKVFKVWQVRKAYKALPGRKALLEIMEQQVHKEFKVFKGLQACRVLQEMMAQWDRKVCKVLQDLFKTELPQGKLRVGTAQTG